MLNYIIKILKIMMQIIEQTDEEKMTMYMKLEKEEIISMLIQTHKVLDSLLPRVYIPTSNVLLNYTSICSHNFRQTDSMWQSCIDCGQIIPLMKL